MADVRVNVDLGSSLTVHLSVTAFAWVPAVYPDADLGSAGHEDLAAAARAGAEYALRAARASGRVQIEEIFYTNADTAPDDVRFAAAFATWDALGHLPSELPWIDADGVHFPGAGG